MRPRLFSSLGETWLYIAKYPGCTIQDITADLYITKRTVWGQVGQLRKAGLLEVAKEGREHHYTVNISAEIELLSEIGSLKMLFSHLARL